jgi:hypothetical protein
MLSIESLVCGRARLVQGPQVDPYPLPSARLRSSLFFGGTVGSENLSTILALRATEEQKRKSWEMAVRIEKIL